MNLTEKPTGSNQLSPSVTSEACWLLLKTLIRLDFPTPLGPTITVVWSTKLDERELSPYSDSTLQNIGS